MTDSRHYKAFISYSHSDEHWARWLQRFLEKYKLPKTFRQSHPELPTRLYPIFRDRDELASGGELSESIRRAMEDSDALIVICSPAARASLWVNEEIKRFKASGRGDRIFCLLVSGSPDVNSFECAFPAAILQDENGYVIHEPLAADATPKGDGKRNAMLKIAAGLLNVGVDDLKQRDAQRQARFWSYIAMGTTFIAALTIGLAIYAFNAKKESEMRQRQAEGLIGFMLGDLRNKLEPIGKLELLDSVGDQAMSYFATLGDRGTPKEMLSRAVALKQIGDVRFQQGKLEPALKAFEQSLIQSRNLYKADPGNNAYLFELGQAEFWVGYVAWERGDLARGETNFQNYMQYSRELLRRDPENKDYSLELSYAHGNLGSLAQAQGNPELAIKNFMAAINIGEALLSNDKQNFMLAQNISESWSWLGTTFLDINQLQKSINAFQKGINILQPFHLAGKDKRASASYSRLLTLQADVLIQTGDTISAKRKIDQASQMAAKLLANDPSNSNWRYDAFKSDYLKLSLLEMASLTDAEMRLLVSMHSKLKEFIATTPTSSDYNVILARTNRLLIISYLSKGETKTALELAEASWSQWQAAVKTKSSTPELNLVEAMLEESIGNTFAATGQDDKAIAHWKHAAGKLDSASRKTLADLAVRRLLAINLQQHEQIADFEKILIKADYRDPRMNPSNTLSGKFHNTTSTSAIKKEH